MLANRVVDAVRSVIGDGTHHLHEPLLIGKEKEYVADCVSKNQLTQGDYLPRFEKMLCDVTGARYAIATCNATCALTAAFWFFDKLEASIPALTFVATANAAIVAGKQIKFSETPQIPVHLLGHRAGQGAIQDAAQALGSNLPLKLYDCLIYSFNGNKIITTGQGGAIVTNNRTFADYLRCLINTARIPHPYKIKHSKTAFNFRMANINAAIGCAQLENFAHILRCKRALAEKYIEAFDSIEGVKVWKEPDGTRSNYWLVSIVFDDQKERKESIEKLHAAGYMARMLPEPLYRQPMYKDVEIVGSMEHTENVYKRTICLPSSPALGVQYV